MMWTSCAREAVCIGAPHAALLAVVLHSLLRPPSPIAAATSGLLGAPQVSYGSVVDPVHTVYRVTVPHGSHGRPSRASSDALFCVVVAVMPWLTAMSLVAWSRFGPLEHVRFSCSATGATCGGAIGDLLCVWASRALITLAWGAMACQHHRNMKESVPYSQQGVHGLVALTAVGLGADLCLCRVSSGLYILNNNNAFEYNCALLFDGSQIYDHNESERFPWQPPVPLYSNLLLKTATFAKNSWASSPVKRPT